MESVPDYNDGTNVLIKFHHLETQTEKAYLVALTVSRHRGMWFPKSLIAHLDKGKREMWIPKWLAEKRGLMYE